MTDTALGSEQPTTEDPATTSAPVEGQAVDTQQKPAEAAAQEQDSTQQDTALAGKPEGAPEAYEITVPEGHELHANVREAFETKARELNLTNEGAQGLIDAVIPALKAGFEERLEAAKTEWMDLSRNDSEIGGAMFDSNIKLANKGLDKVGNDDVRQLLQESGFCNHPAFVRMFMRIGKAISPESTILTGGTPPAAARDISDPAVQADVLFGQSKQ